MDPKAVFKAYDIRGRTDNGELDAELYRRVGVALAGVVEANTFVVGRDCRASSDGFFQALADGITSTGASVVDLGEVPTDAVYFYSGSHNVPGAIITASHNPPVYNGLKLCREGAAPIGMGSGLEEILRRVIDWEGPPNLARGAIRAEMVIPDYVDHLFSVVPESSISALEVAVDGGNGMAGVAIEDVFARIDAQLTGLYLAPDGTFPNHPADPLVPENLRDLQVLVAEGGHDLGVAFDGDADRAFFLDDEAEPLPGSTVTSLVGRRILADNPGAAVVHNLITSKAVAEIVTEAGGTPVRTRVGHSFIKQVMAETGAVFGGEHSGHYYFRDNFRADSGMLAMLYLMRVISEDSRPLSEIRHDVERYSSSGEINFRVRDIEAAISSVEGAFTEAQVDHLDGLTVDLGVRWFNLRPSNTEPLLRLNAEAESREGVNELVERVSEIVERK